MASISILVSVLLLHFMVQNGESLLCWICSSDLNPACNDPFLFPNVTQYVKLEKCEQIDAAIYPDMSAFKSACKKQKKNVNGNLVILRSCTWMKLDDNSTTCLNHNNTPNTSNELCEICEYDGCNGAEDATAKVKKL